MVKMEQCRTTGRKGAAIGAIMGGGGSLLTMRDAVNNPLGTTDEQNNTSALADSIIRTVPKKIFHANTKTLFNAFEDAKQAEAQAQAEYEANPTPESEEALAQAIRSTLKKQTQFTNMMQRLSKHLPNKRKDF